MKYINSKLYYCLLASLVMVPDMSEAAPIIRVGNQARSYAQAYNQVNAQRAGTDVATGGAATGAAVAAATLPVPVSDEALASKIIANDPDAGVTIDTLQQCALIYPDASFEWTKPNLGVNAGKPAMCSAVVELYAYGAGQNGENLLVARGTLAAGDAFKCNVSEFPESSLFPAAGTVVFPNDAEPTEAEVVAVMDKEQEQSAGLKIAAATVLAGLAGNALGKNEPGKDGLFGGGKSKLISTAVSAVGGGGLMAASVYSGKVAGDVIASAGVNAAMGAIVGNVAATGDDRLRFEKCKLNDETVDCLYGYILTSKVLDINSTVFVNIANPDTFMVCESKCNDNKNKVDVQYRSEDNCFYECSRTKIKLSGNYKVANKSVNDIENPYYSRRDLSLNKGNTTVTLDDMARDNFAKFEGEHYVYEGEVMIPAIRAQDGAATSVNLKYVKVEADNGGKLAKVTSKEHAAIALDKGVRDKLFGYKKEDWNTAKSKFGNDIYSRSVTGGLHNCDNCSIDNFEPEVLSASDGDVIDLNNKARLGTTLAGAGTGAALGGYTAGQAAKTEIQERWVAAVREYKDSLQKFYCYSGNRFLGFYNDVVLIPNMTPVSSGQ